MHVRSNPDNTFLKWCFTKINKRARYRLLDTRYPREDCRYARIELYWHHFQRTVLADSRSSKAHDDPETAEAITACR